METWNELLEPLLVGLDTGDQRSLLRRIDVARDEQLDRKLHPRPRRRRRKSALQAGPPPETPAGSPTTAPTPGPSRGPSGD